MATDCAGFNERQSIYRFKNTTANRLADPIGLRFNVHFGLTIRGCRGAQRSIVVSQCFSNVFLSDVLLLMDLLGMLMVFWQRVVF